MATQVLVYMVKEILFRSDIIKSNKGGWLATVIFEEATCRVDKSRAIATNKIVSANCNTYLPS